jgi:hypothetical protein
MTTQNSLISNMEEKLGQLLERYLLLFEKNENYRNEVQDLAQTIDGQKVKIRELEARIKTLTLTKTIENKEGAAEAKTRINELVREIDKCIGLLNK